MSRFLVVVSLASAAPLLGGCFPQPSTCDGCGDSGDDGSSGLDPTMTAGPGSATESSGPSTDGPSSSTDTEDTDATGPGSDTDTDSDSSSSTGSGSTLNTPSACGGGDALDWNAASFTVSGIDFSVGFSEAEWHNISSLQLGGSDVLFGGGGTAPDFLQGERLAGVGLYAGEESEYGYADFASDNSPYILVSSGPAVVFVTVLWGDHCNSAPCAGINGTTYFTITPDGRVVRDDVVNTNRSGGGEWLTSYVSLNPSLFDRYSWGGDATQRPTALEGHEAAAAQPGNALMHMQGIASGDDQWLCLSNDGGGRAVGYTAFPHPFIHDTATHSGEARITETAVAGIPSYGVALQYDWVRSGNVDQENYGGYFMMYGDPDDDGECSCIAAQSEAYLHPPNITAVSGGSVALSEFMADDGSITGDVDSDGFYERGGYYGIEDTMADEPVVVRWPSDLQSVLLFVEADGPAQSVSIGDQQLGPDVWFTQHEGGVAWVYIGAEIPGDTEVTIEL